MTPLTVIILTQDEALHIARAITSVQGFATHVLVVDSGSTDDTVTIARAAGAEVLFHPWTTHAAQFNWALDRIADRDGWVLRLDADEAAGPALAAAVARGLPAGVSGCYVTRRIRFMGDLIRYGGVGGLATLRLFQNGQGRAETRWMDEHIIVQGQTVRLDAEIIDDNRKPLDWWIAKHNAYASREVVDLLLHPHGAAGARGAKRWIKDHLYARLPAGVRAGAYFIYRYLLRGGFRDAAGGRRYHVLQGFWYRYLVDAKLAEVRRHMARNRCTAEAAVVEVLGISVISDRQRKAA